jgi:DHA2 family multidrug resistance protein
LAGNEWNSRTILHHSRLIESASVSNPLFNQQIAASQSLLHLNAQSAYAQFDLAVTAQAAMMGLNDIFYISAGIFILIIPLIWITRPAKGGAGGAAAGAH